MNPNKLEGVWGNTKNKEATTIATYLFESFLRFLYIAPLKNNSSAIPTNSQIKEKKTMSITGLKIESAFN